MKRKWFKFIMFFIFIILVFIGYKKIQEANRTMISSDNITNISFSYQDFSLSGNVNLEWYEMISYYHAQQINDTVYICISKTIGVGEHRFDIDIKMNIEDYVSDDVKRIMLVSGDDIIVKYPNNPQKNYINVLNYDKSVLLWER